MPVAIDGTGSIAGLTTALSVAQGGTGAVTAGAALTTIGAPLNATVALTAAYTVVAADRGKLFDCSGTFTVTLTAAATLGAGFSFAVRNSGTGVITLDPDAAELVDGGATIASSAGDAYAVTCTGTAFKTVGRRVGKILQVVHLDTGAVATGTTLIPFDDTIPQQTEGDQYMSLAITPISATSTLRIDVVMMLANNTTDRMRSAALFRDAVADAVGGQATFMSLANSTLELSFSVVVSAVAVAATTFKVRAGGDAAGTTTFNGNGGARKFGGVAASSIRITEIAA